MTTRLPRALRRRRPRPARAPWRARLRVRGRILAGHAHARWARHRTAALTAGGFACIVAGLTQVWRPAGWLAAGVALLLVEHLGGDEGAGRG